MKQLCFLVSVAAFLALAITSSAPVAAYLKLHPDNPHYFQETTTGKPVIIVGHWGCSPQSDTYETDYHEDLYKMGAWHCNMGRVWHFTPWEYADGYNPLWPWNRSSTPGAYMGGNKFDLNTWNSQYWTNMADAMWHCEELETYMEIMLFDRCGMSPAAWYRWGCNPWASDNNINSLEVPGAAYDGTPEFYQWSSKPNLKYQQERYIKKMIDETVTYDSVYYEIENEHWDSNSSGWADHYAQFVKDYISANYPSYPKLVSYSSILSDSDLHQCFGWSSIDVVNKHYGSELDDDPSLANTYLEGEWGHNKAISIDEFANGLEDIDILREECWTIITSGGNFQIEGISVPGNDFAGYIVTDNISRFIRTSGWDFINANPNKNRVVSGGGYCMAQAGVEYVFYFPTGGSKTINIASGNYRQEWWNPRTGGFYNVTSISHGGGDRGVSTPDSNDWVLHLDTQSAHTTVLQSKYASSAITIDGSSSDWNLGEFTTRIPAGEIGTGNKAIVGYDTNGICYKASYSTSCQFPPGGVWGLYPEDHGVQIYSRNNASYLYILIRCNDDDIEYPNGVDSNWANDCVEIYIDPSHNHGSSSLSGSTSDIQLVIDANNQKNVYCTTSGYKTQVLAGVTSAVSTDSTGWWLEVRISKSVLDPDIPATGTIGIDFNLRDNDDSDSAETTVYTWNDSSSDGFPSKVPNRWGDMELQGVPDTTPPANVTNFTATAGTLQVALGWTNPTDSDFTGTMIRFKTTGYPTSITDGTLVEDHAGSPSQADGCTHTGLAAGVTYYYKAFSHDGVPNYASGVTAYATPYAPSLSTINTKSASNLNLVIDASSSDWSLGDFTTKSRGGQNEVGDIAIIGFDGGTCYYGGYCTSLVLPASATDHTAKVYSRHDQQYMYFLVRCDDDQMNYANGADTNWANDCIEFYIDPGHNHGSTSISDSTSDLQLVIDANNQKNVYMTTSGYKTQVLAGVTSAVVRDGTGWWLEVKILKTAVDPDLPASGTFGVDFCFRDNDNPDQQNYAGNPAYSTMYSWRDNPSGASFPTKVPDKWGDTSLATLAADTTPPASVTGFIATAGAGQIGLTWNNPATADWAGTMIRFKTTGYPTGPTDGTQCYNGTDSSYNHTGLTNGVTYYYCAYAYDEVPNYATAAQANATPTAPTLSTINVKSAANMNLVIDASSTDWSLGDFTTKSLGGQNTQGDIAIVGYDGATCYYGRYDTGFVLPTSATDHTAKVYSRHDHQYQYFLVRCDDSDMCYANGVDANWANDCIEFYIDPGHNHGSTSISSSTSDLQLVIDCNNQKNVYMTTSGYKTQVLAGVTSAVVRDGTGWWLEVKILKTAVDPDIANSGTFGVDFCFRDNDNYDGDPISGEPAYSTMYSWRDAGTGSFPTKIPDNWGDASLATLAADTTPPAPVTSFAATGGNQQVSLSWTNPATADWAGTMIRFKTTGYPTGPTDGTQCYNGTAASYNHTGLSAGTTYYYCAYAYDEVPNYATAAQANATPTSEPVVISNSQFNSSADGWTITTWKSGDYSNGTMVWSSTGGNPGGCMKSTGSGSTDNTDRCTREGGEIKKTISTSGHSGIKVYYDLKVNSLGANNTGTGSGGCTVDHNLVDEQLTVFYSTDGGSNWTEAEYLLRAALLASYQSYGTRSIDLTGVSGCNNNANFALRFRWQFNTLTDTGWLDNIKVEANQ